MIAVAELTDRLLTREEAARYLGVRPRTLGAWMSLRARQLPYVRFGRIVRYRKCDLDAFIAIHTITPNPQPV